MGICTCDKGKCSIHFYRSSINEEKEYTETGKVKKTYKKKEEKLVEKLNPCECDNCECQDHSDCECDDCECIVCEC